MKLYTEFMAPNGRRVLMFLAEKGITLETEVLDFSLGEHKSTTFLAMNPLGQVPVLVLDNGVCISESISICRYLDEVNPEPNLFGRDATERAEIDMWQRRVENGVLSPAIEFGHHSLSLFENMMQQFPEVAEFNKQRFEAMLLILDQHLKSNEYLSPRGFSVADISAYLGMVVGVGSGIPLRPGLGHLNRWFKQLKARPSAACVKYD